LLPFYPFYYFAINNILTAKHLIRFFLLILPVFILQYFFNNQALQEFRDSENVVNNIAYTFVMLIPYVFLIKTKRIWTVLLMLLLMFFIIQGAKRGAIFAGAFGLLVFVYYQLRTVSKKNRIKGYLLSILGIILVSYFAYDFYLQNEFLIERMRQLEEGNTSGRNVIYSNVFNSWYNSDSLLNIIFGFGFAASIHLSGMGRFAHNDWLELLSNFGIVGVTIYLLFFYGLLKNLVNPKWNVDKKLVILVVVIIWLIVTLISMGYTSESNYLLTIMIAYLIGSRSKSLN
jgi:O-antigen ligase